MAEAFARKHGLRAQSAGSQPAGEVNPTVVKLMREKGLDLSMNKPKILIPEMIERASLVVTMGCSVEEVCPRPMIAAMQKKLIDWHLEDPKEKPIEEVRLIRDEIEIKVADLARSHGRSKDKSQFKAAL